MESASRCSLLDQRIENKKYSYTFLKEKRDKTKRLYLGHTQKMTHYNNARSSEKKMRSILLKISKKYFLEGYFRTEVIDRL